MKIGIIGGTGGMGKGFALRWCKNHEILIGSRDAQRASEAAAEYLQTAKQDLEVLTEQYLAQTMILLPHRVMF